MNHSVCCDDFNKLIVDKVGIFKYNETYKWIILWNEVSKDGYKYIINRYAVSIKYCPFCGNLLNENINNGG